MHNTGQIQNFLGVNIFFFFYGKETLCITEEVCTQKQLRFVEMKVKANAYSQVTHAGGNIEKRIIQSILRSNALFVMKSLAAKTQ